MVKDLLNANMIGLLLNVILKVASKALKVELKKHLSALKEKASKTDNPYDDMLVMILEQLLEICDCQNDKDLPSLKS